MARAFRTKREVTRDCVSETSDDVAMKAEEIGVPAAQIARGGFEIHDVRIDDGERTTTHRTLMNRGGCAVDRWLAEKPSVLFHEPEKAAIKYCRGLWARIDKKGPPDLSGVRASLWMGQSEHEALAELSEIKKKFPPRMWNCFENIVRFEMDAPSAGSKLATNTRSASDGAKMCVAFVAGMIAQWRGF